MTEAFETYAVRLREQKLFEMEEIYQNHFHEFVPTFQKHFSEICETIIKLQKSGNLGEISYLEYTLLYSNLIQKKKLLKFVSIMTTGTSTADNLLQELLIFLLSSQNTMNFPKSLWLTENNLPEQSVHKK